MRAFIISLAISFAFTATSFAQTLRTKEYQKFVMDANTNVAVRGTLGASTTITNPLPVHINQREYDKFGMDSQSNVAIRVIIEGVVTGAVGSGGITVTKTNETLYISGSGFGSNWSLFVALTNIDMGGFSITNLGTNSIVFEDGYALNRTNASAWDSTATNVDQDVKSGSSPMFGGVNFSNVTVSETGTVDQLLSRGSDMAGQNMTNGGSVAGSNIIANTSLRVGTSVVVQSDVDDWNDRLTRTLSDIYYDDGTVLDFSTNYITLTNWVGNITNGVASDPIAGEMTIQRDGLYGLGASVSFDGGVNTVYEFAFWKVSGVTTNELPIECQRKTSSADTACVAMFGYANLLSNDVITVRGKHVSGTADPTMRKGQMTAELK